MGYFSALMESDYLLEGFRQISQTCYHTPLEVGLINMITTGTVMLICSIPDTGHSYFQSCSLFST